MKKGTFLLQLQVFLVGIVLILLAVLLSQQYKSETFPPDPVHPYPQYDMVQGKAYHDFEVMRLLGRQCPSCSGWW